jgi:hypothetical protein
MSIKLRSNITSEYENQEDSMTTIFTMVWPMPTPGCGDLLWLMVALNPSQVIQRSNLSATIVFHISMSYCEESPQIGVSHALHK